MISIHTTRVVAKVLLVSPSGSVLLLRRSGSDSRRPLQWDLPGGAVDDGESFHAAAVRETMEEAGIVIHERDLTLGFSMAEETDKGNVCWLFYVAPVTAPLAVTLSHEHSESQWVPLAEVENYIQYKRQQRALRHIADHVVSLAQ